MPYRLLQYTVVPNRLLWYTIDYCSIDLVSSNLVQKEIDTLSIARSLSDTLQCVEGDNHKTMG